MKGRVVVHGELFLTLETVAECYRVETSWLREAYDLGLFGRGRRAEGSVAIRAVHLDRVAQVVRLHVFQGVNLPGVLLLLGALTEE